jgi:hypothetical protein
MNSGARKNAQCTGARAVRVGAVSVVRAREGGHARRGLGPTLPAWQLRIGGGAHVRAPSSASCQLSKRGSGCEKVTCAAVCDEYACVGAARTMNAAGRRQCAGQSGVVVAVLRFQRGGISTSHQPFHTLHLNRKDASGVFGDVDADAIVVMSRCEV